MNIDFGKTAADYGRFRAGFPDPFYDRLFDGGYLQAGDRVVDLGAGTGTIARALALRGCSVTGVDPAQPLLDVAKALDKAADAQVHYVSARAERLGLASGAFDAVTAGQCWHWFDRREAALEVRRLLKSAGRLIIAHFDWLPLPGNVVEATERLILSYNPAWQGSRGTGIYPQWPLDIASAGFTDIETFSFDASVRYDHEAWRGRIRASAGVAASLPPETVATFDKELASMLAAQFATDPLLIPHRVWALVCHAP